MCLENPRCENGCSECDPKGGYREGPDCVVCGDTVTTTSDGEPVCGACYDEIRADDLAPEAVDEEDITAKVQKPTDGELLAALPISWFCRDCEFTFPTKAEGEAHECPAREVA